MKELFELTELADKCLKSGKQVEDEVVSKLRDIVQGKQYVGMAQINTKPGDLEYNAKKIAKYIKFATDIGLESVVFPELSLIGYPLEDTVSRYPFLGQECYKWLEGLANITKDTIALVGFLWPDQFTGKYRNSVAILQNGNIQKIVVKSVIHNNLGTNDSKYQINLKEIGSTDNEFGYKISIGDECFNTEYQNKLTHSRFNILINTSNIPTSKNKDFIHSLPLLAYDLKTPLVYVNQVGANDNMLFDGISCVYDSNGNLIARANAFDEQFMIANPYNGVGKVYPIPAGYNMIESFDYKKEIELLEYSFNNKKEFSLDYDNDMERTYRALVLGVKDYFNKCGFKRAVLGLSGGLDSTVCAVILVDALGKDNVLGVSMPSHITSTESKSDAEQLANNLGIHFTEAPIRDMIDTTTESFNKLFEKVETSWSDRYKKSFTPDNIQARSRAMYLWGVSNEFPSCIPIATSDKSEAYMGYATINGDMSGGFAPIADITKTKLFALARWLNKNRIEKNVIPESVINKRPGAELAIDSKTGKPLKAEDALMPYEFLDEIIWRIENNHETYQEMLNSKFLYEKQNSVSKEQKVEWLDKFYNRMSKAFYKWSIMSPSVMIEPHSINHIDYRQPITSCGINYKGVSKEYITENLA